MSKSGTLYTVYAGSKLTGYYPVYETTKRSKADSYVHDMLKRNNDYDKVYITSKPLSKFDKRTEWED